MQVRTEIQVHNEQLAEAVQRGANFYLDTNPKIGSPAYYSGKALDKSAKEVINLGGSSGGGRFLMGEVPLY